MNIKRLRSMIHRYGNVGVLFVGTYLMWHSLWQRKSRLLLVGGILLLLASSILLLGHRTPSQDQPYLLKQQRLNSTLLEAIKQEDTAAALTALRAGADPNAKDKPSEHGEVVRIMGRNLEVNDAGLPPLLVEECEGYENPVIIQALVSKGADVNAKDMAGMTVLMHAVGYQHAATVKILLAKGADIHARDNDGHSVLWWVAGPDRAALVRLLRQNDTK